MIIIILGHCPTGDDPFTLVVETNCTGVTAQNSIWAGSPGNLCHVDCSNRGICNYRTATCQCFDGLYGEACNVIDADAVYTYWSKGMGPHNSSHVHINVD